MGMQRGDDSGTDMRVAVMARSSHDGTMNVGYKTELFPVLCDAWRKTTTTPAIATTTCDLGEHEGAIPDELLSNSGGCEVCLGQCVQENHFMSLSDPAACSKCAAQECRSVCDEEHVKDGVQHYID